MIDRLIAHRPNRMPFSAVGFADPDALISRGGLPAAKVSEGLERCYSGPVPDLEIG
jgi:hypothetical protein